MGLELEFVIFVAGIVHIDSSMSSICMVFGKYPVGIQAGTPTVCFILSLLDVCWVGTSKRAQFFTFHGTRLSCYTRGPKNAAFDTA